MYRGKSVSTNGAEYSLSPAKHSDNTPNAKDLCASLVSRFFDFSYKKKIINQQKDLKKKYLQFS